MKAIKIISPYDLQIIEIPIPKISNDKEVLIKVKAAGICGSDIHIYHGTSPVATYPRVIGHEVVGEVIEIGNDVRKLKIGDHVTIDPVISCGDCYPCSIGRGNVCVSLKVRGVHVDGGYQEYVVASESSAHKISIELTWEEAVMIEPFTIAAQVCSRGEITKTDTVFIMGAGPVGQSILQVAKKIGAKCIISDLVDTKLEKARSLGADRVIDVTNENVREVIMMETGNRGVTVLIDAVCTKKSFEEALTLTTPAGRIVVLGFSDQPSNIPQLNITARELDIRGSRLHNNKFPQVVEWFNSKEIIAKNMISHVFHFEDVKKAIELVEDRSIENEKVVLKFD